VTFAGSPRPRAFRADLHGLRHSSATAALVAGVPVKVVSERLGHATTAITSDLYTHVLGATDRAAADQAAGLILGPLQRDHDRLFAACWQIGA